MKQDHSAYLNIALKEAKKALSKKEVPVGAIVVLDNKIISKAHNLKESKNDPTGHAEIQAIIKATKKLNNWRLTNCYLYSTLEPCPMCAGAILQARIKHVIYGAKDLKWGAAGSIVNLFSKKLFNHYVETEYLPLNECEEILKSFFKQLR
jgi:tRNA(adenine34) deaminase